jgi:hypothetical protein
MAKSNRKTVDTVFVLLGIVMTVVLLVVGGLACYASNFAKTSVKNELSEQKIYFPEKGSPAITSLPAEDQAQVNKYAGQQLVNGDQAKVYANNFIKVHLDEVAGGQTYAEVSSKALANPTDTKLQGQVNTLFKGETLRGLLLGDGYSYWTFGKIAQYAAVASFAGAALMAVLVLMGLPRITNKR